MSEPIDSFTGKYRFLSNFYFHPIRYFSTWDQRVLHGDTVEHIFQAMKARKVGDSTMILRAPTPGQAKRRGRRVDLRPDWEKIKFVVMLDLVREKFKDQLLATSLLETAPCELIEGNTWGDTYWGVCGGKGENNLGKILMTVRTEIALERRG